MRCLKDLMGGSFFSAQASRAFSSRRKSIPAVGRKAMPVSDTSLQKERDVMIVIVILHSYSFLFHGNHYQLWISRLHLLSP